MAEKKSSVPKRFRNYATIVYPESAPEGWEEVLSSYHIPAFISPLHDKDKLPDGSLKKPHYHVMIMFDNVKTMEQVKEIFDSFCGVGCEVIQALSGYARYLCHIDNPEKHQYSVDDVRSIAGADYYNLTHTTADRHKALNDMRQYCQDNDIVSFSDFWDYCALNNFEWFKLIADNSAYVMDRYLKARYWTKGNMSEKKYDVRDKLLSMIDKQREKDPN